MCEACMPMCGACKPAKIVIVLCPVCGKGTMVSREDCLLHLKRPFKGARSAESSGGGGPILCKHCAADLGEEVERAIQPLPCKYSGIVCGYPCGKRDRERSPDDPPCGSQVPMGRLG